MANNADNEHQPRAPIRLVISVLLLGTLLAWWGTRGHRQLFGESLRQPVTAAAVVVPQSGEENSALVNRGYEITQRQCAGCHEMTMRSNAPSYREIVTFYRRQFPATTGDPDLRSRLASAVTHPQPGWGNFAPGPPDSGLSADERVALATWMLNSFDPARNVREGMGK